MRCSTALLLALVGCSTPTMASYDTAPLSGLPPINAPADATEYAVPVVERTTVSTSPAAPTWMPAPKYSNWPLWRTTIDDVPYYSGRPSCDVEQAAIIAHTFANRGASVETQWWSVYVASREGGCDYTTTFVNATTGDDSHCFFQLNARRGGPLSASGVLGQMGWTVQSVSASFVACAQAGADLWSICGKGPWIRGDYSCKEPIA